MRTLRLRVAAALAVVAVALGTDSALAVTQFSTYWSTNDLTGTCGDQRGGYVVALQLFEHTLGSNPDPIDNIFGVHTDSGLRALQRYYGVTVDGCAGSQTWSKMRGSLLARCAAGYVCYPYPEASHYADLGYGRVYFGKSSSCAWISVMYNVTTAGAVVYGNDYSFDPRLIGKICTA
jgi:hypothetical protein